MKKRDGFVSNSSSSSFIIISKSKLNPEFVFDKIAKGISENTIFYGIAKEVAEILCDDAYEVSVDELFDDYDFYQQKVDGLSLKTRIPVAELNKLNTEAFNSLCDIYEVIDEENNLKKIQYIAKNMNIDSNFLYDVYQGNSILYRGELSSEGTSLEAMLCDTDFDHVATDFYMHHDGGY